ncbi:MAG: catalase [Algicola sp.]|nr:catalase [Algicola sp.]
MNIVTPYPTNIPINTVNVTTESARRDSQLRELIAKPSATEAGVAERGVASEHDKSKSPQQNQNSVEVNLSKGDEHQKIGERGHGEQSEKDQGQEKEKQNKDKEQEQANKQLERVEAKQVQQEQQQIQELRGRDAEVKAHEQAHAAAGGQYAGSPTYEFKRGPDGNNYAVGGEVSIDASAVGGDPRATIDKMRQVRSAALAPASPSSQDRAVAAQAAQTATDARVDEIDQANAAIQAKEQAKDEKTAAADEAETAAKAEKANNAQSASETGPVADPFGLLGDDENAQPGQQIGSANSLGKIFGSSGLAGGENRDQINFNRLAAEQRNSEVVARAARVQSFYSASTVPRSGGFSSFA